MNMETLEPWRVHDVENHGAIKTWPRLRANAPWGPREIGDEFVMAPSPDWRVRRLGGAENQGTMEPTPDGRLATLTLGRPWRRSRHAAIAGLRCHQS
jgi:hypothetical protein